MNPSPPDECHICGAPNVREALAAQMPTSCYVCYNLEVEAVTPPHRVSSDELQRRHRRRISHFRMVDPLRFFAQRREAITDELAQPIADES